MADNLTVTIGADSSKLRAELAIVSQATKAATKELNTLAATFNKTGQSADRIALDAKARQLDQYKRSAAALNTEIAKLSPTFDRAGRSAEHAASGLQEFIHQGRGLGRVVAEFSSLTRSVESFGGIFGRITGGFAGGLFGVTVGRAFSAIGEQINKVRENLLELQKTAGGIGQKPIVLQAAREIAAQTGQSADDATKLLQGLNREIEEVRKNSTQRPTDVIPVMRGGQDGGQTGARMIQLSGAFNTMTTVIRGGKQDATDFSGFLKALKVDLSNIPVGKLGDLTLQIRALQTFMEATKTWDTTALNLVAKNLDQTAESLKKLAPAYIANLQKQIDALQKAPRGATDPAVKAAEDLAAEQARLKQALDDSAAAANTALTPFQKWLDALETQAITNFNNNLVSTINYIKAFGTAANDAWQSYGKGAVGALQAFNPTWNEFLAGLTSKSTSAWAAFLAGTQTAADTFKSIWQSTLEWLSNAISTVGSAVKSAVSATANAIGTAAASGVPFAAGGMVRGSGTGTSDSILARLSNGEFVMSTKAVQHWGPQLLASLNSLRNPGFALGGLVSPPHFAEGGPVTAGGTPVHLHLGGNSFALSGHDNVVNALVVEAHRQQMRSAGTKPSWFAARPNG